MNDLIILLVLWLTFGSCFILGLISFISFMMSRCKTYDDKQYYHRDRSSEL